jgi:hypothetical protein
MNSEERRNNKGAGEHSGKQVVKVRVLKQQGNNASMCTSY